MTRVWIAVLVALFLVGCEHSSPTSPLTSDAGSSATYGLEAMVKGAVAANAELLVEADSGVCPHDSLRHRFMLDSLSAYLSLTPEQLDSVKVYAAALQGTLEAVKAQAIAKTITRAEADTLVKAARDLFVASVRTVLTADQSTLFDTWLAKYWTDRPHGHRGGHGGHGGHGGPGGPGGPGGHEGPGGRGPGH